MLAICVVLPASFSALGMFAPHILLWEAFVSLALFGFGFALLRLLREQAQPIAVSACAGVAVWLFLGGWLNFAHLASRRVLLLSLSVGFLLCLWEIARQDMRVRFLARLRGIATNRPGRNAGLLIALYFFLVFAASLRPIAWNRYDDQQGYMALADKASAFSSMQSDPFSERRIVTGLGGGIFLDVTMLAGADDSAMGYIDGGFGYLIYILAIWSLIRALGLANRRAVAVLYLVPIFTLGKVNQTIVYLSAAFFIAVLLLLLRLDRRSPLPPRIGLLLGLLLGAAYTMKSSNIPFGSLLLAVCGIAFAFQARNPRRLLPFLIPALPIAAVLLPWMLQLHRDQGTYLFPSFGLGDHVTAYGLLPLPSHAPLWQSLLITAPNAIVMLLFGILSFLLIRRSAISYRIQIASFFVASVISTLALGISVGGEAIDRYTLPFTVPCTLLFFSFILIVWNRRERTPYLRSALFVAAVWTVFFCYVFGKREFFYDPGQLLTLAGRTDKLQFYDAALDPSTIQANISRVRRAQDTIPAGETILESTATAYGYDWHRNTVYIADYPGMAGLPPGPPVFDNAEAFRRYLLHCGIHYVLYDRSLLVPPSTDFNDFRRNPMQRYPLRRFITHPPSMRSIAPLGTMENNISNHTRVLFQQIAASHRVIYDEDSIEVIRLNDSD